LRNLLRTLALTVNELLHSFPSEQQVRRAEQVTRDIIAELETKHHAN
jgi:hypothetical protein